MLVRDPEIDRLAALLRFVRPIVSDVVISVDDRTDPATCAVMAAWPDVRLVPITWTADFSVARNAALPHCQGDWTLILDPDELPSLELCDFLGQVDRAPRGAALGYLFWTVNYWGGVEGPPEPYHWHCRLFRTGMGRFYRPIHELVELAIYGGAAYLPENETRDTPMLPAAPSQAILIHSKSAAAISRDDATYATYGESVR